MNNSNKKRQSKTSIQGRQGDIHTPNISILGRDQGKLFFFSFLIIIFLKLLCKSKQWLKMILKEKFSLKIVMR